MARLPDETALGGIPIGGSGRPIATVDTTGYSRGAAAIAAGVADLGKGMQSAVRDVAAAVNHERAEDTKLEVARAKADFLTQKVELDSSLANETDHEKLPGVYSAKLEEIRLKSAAHISNPRTRELFTLSTADDVARGNAAADATANKLWKDATLADAQTRLEATRQAALKSQDPEERKKLIDTGTELISSLAAKGVITQSSAVKTQQEWATKYAAGAISMLEPVDRVRVLGGFEKTLVRSESGGNPGRINQLGYAGLYQFGAPRLEAMGVYKPGAGEDLKNWSATGKDAPGKWSGTFAIPGHPEIRTVADFLKSPDAQRTAFQIHTKKMDQEIEKNGFDQYIGQTVGGTRITREGLYAMLHLGGVGGTRDALTGKANAKDANGKSVMDYARLGSQSDLTRVAALLPEDTRVRMLNDAESDLHRETASNVAGLKSRLQDSLSEAMTTGNVAKPLLPEEFVLALGEDAGMKAYVSYQADVQLGRDIGTVARLSPEEQSRLYQDYQPAPGSEGYAERAKRQETLGKAIAQVTAEVRKDPAAFAVSRLPVVQEAYGHFNASLADPAATPAARQAAARDFALKMDMELERIGVPAADRRLVPKGYIDNLNSLLSKPQTAGGTGNVVAVLEREAAIWGDNWPRVFRELSKDAQPVVRVIGSGVKPAAAQLLVELEKIPLPEILKDQDAERSATVKKDVLEAFKPLAATMVGNEGGVRAFNDFRQQGEKLSAYYVMQGMSSSDAAAKAFEDLVGHKYTFSSSVTSKDAQGRVSTSSYRIPKDVPVKPDVIAAGALEAKAQLERLGVAPWRSRTGLPDDYNARATYSALARDGVWVTAADESGLALFYEDQAVLRRDGTPLVLSWAELGSLGQTNIDARPPGSGIGQDARRYRGGYPR